MHVTDTAACMHMQTSNICVNRWKSSGWRRRHRYPFGMSSWCGVKAKPGARVRRS